MKKHKRKPKRKKKVSEAQLRANRENAKKSTGAKTDEGKRKIRLNALKIGLCCTQFTLMEGESEDAWNEHLQMMLAELDPQGYEEYQLAIVIAQDWWVRHRRGSAEWLVAGETTNFEDWLYEMNKIDLYINRIDNRIRRNRNAFRQLQAQRRRGERVVIENGDFLAPIHTRGADDWDIGPTIPRDMPFDGEAARRRHEKAWDIALSLREPPDCPPVTAGDPPSPLMEGQSGADPVGNPAADAKPSSYASADAQTRLKYEAFVTLTGREPDGIHEIEALLGWSASGAAALDNPANPQAGGHPNPHHTPPGGAVNEGLKPLSPKENADKMASFFQGVKSLLPQGTFSAQTPPDPADKTQVPPDSVPEKRRSQSGG